jgi:chromosome segregation ATPase
VQQRITDSEAAQAVQAGMRQKFEDQLNEYKKEVKFLDERYDDQAQKFDRLEDKISELEHENVELKLTNGGVELVKQEYELKQVEFSRQYDELKKKSDEAAAAAKRKFDKVVEQRDHEWRNCLKRQEQIDHLHAQLQANVSVDSGANERIARLEQRLQNEEVQHRITADRAAKDRELRGVAERKVASLEKQLKTA